MHYDPAMRHLQSHLAPPGKLAQWASLAVIVSMAGGCHEHGRQEFDDADPATRISAIHAAAVERDANQLPELIESLLSDDAAERLLAIRTLERMTGQTFGYDHAAPLAERRAAADRWADWYHAQSGDQSAGRAGVEQSGESESATNP